MDRAQLDPIAAILVPAYESTAAYSRQFRDEWGSPPTLFTKVHHMRSITQAVMTKSDRFVLDPEFSEFGRVQFTDATTERCYLLRSVGHISIERAKRQGVLFDATRYLRAEVVLLAYCFHEQGLDLSVTGTRRAVGKNRLEASGPLIFIGSWAFTSTEPPPFDQGEGDVFAELGDMDAFGEDETG